MIGQDLHLAYIDPGAGSIVIQVIIGTLLAAPYVLRKQLSRAYHALRRRKPEPPPDGGKQPPPAEG